MLERIGAAIKINLEADYHNNHLNKIISGLEESTGIARITLRNQYITRHFKINEITAILNAIPQTVSKLCLSMNNLNKLTALELRTFFFNLAPHITYLDLSENEFGHFSLQDLQTLKGALPHIESIIFGYEEMKDKPRTWLNHCRAIFPNIKKVTLLNTKNDDNYRREFNPSLTIEGINLVKSLGDKMTPPPSLKTQCVLFMKDHMNDCGNWKILPPELKKLCGFKKPRF